MRNYIRNELGFDLLFPLDLTKNEYLAIGVIGRTYNNKHTIYKVRFDSNIYRNLRPKVTYESVELSLSLKREALEVLNYIKDKIDKNEKN